MRKTLEQIGVPRATFYRWYDLYQTGGPVALEDRPGRPGGVWNRIAPPTFCASGPISNGRPSEIGACSTAK